jgi:hypothetical protein
MMTIYVIGGVIAFLFLVTTILLKIESRHFGIRYLFSKKRRAIINSVIDLIKTDPDGWIDVEYPTKKYNKSSLEIATHWFDSEANISSGKHHREKHTIIPSFLECVWLDWYFLKLAKNE